jgi:ATP-binding cassette subfamily B protein
MRNELLPSSDLDFMRSVLQKVNASLLFLFIVFLLSGQVLYLSLASILGRLVDQFAVKNDYTLTFWLLCFPLVWLASVVLSSFGRFYCSVITQRVRNISKEIIFKYLISLPSSVYVTKDAGEVESLMQELSFNARFVFNENLSFFLRTAVTLLAAMVMLSMISTGLLALFLAWLVIYFPVSYFSAKRSVKDISQSILNASKVSAATVEVIQNHELIPAFGTEAFEASRFNHLLKEEEQSFNTAQKRIDLCDLWQRILQVILPLAFVLFLSFEKSPGFTPGTIASLLSLTLILAGQIGDLGKGVLSFLEMRERMKTALATLAHSIQVPEWQQGTAEPSHWDIYFENVNFSYGGSPTLKAINLKIAEGEKIGIIGYSGAGKTTLTKLLRGFLTAENGQVKIGGESVNHIHPKYLAQNIAEVSQNVPLFHRTIRENISYGLDRVSDEEIWKILEKARMLEYVKSLPEKLDTIIGVRGQKLSGGERARIAIARAFIRNSKIIIMDEALAAVDSESERLIQDGLNDLMVGRTIVAIAHRLSTLRSVDKIILMDKGQIVAQGSHQTLIQNNDFYQRLWSTQVFI